jgi:succinyl-CoA synthetase beta subunit
VDVEIAEGSQFIRRTFDPRNPLNPYMARQMAEAAGLNGKALISVGVTLSRLAEAFVTCDINVLEINPFVETINGKFIGLDAHAEIEDDALARQQQRLDPIGVGTSANAHRPLKPLEIEAERIDRMDYRGVAGRVVEFDGDLALLIGGGGASLTIFDAIQRYGGRPANYCEVGGNPTEEKVAALTALLLSKPGVRTMAVIMNVVNNTRADVMARGVLMGVERLNKKPADVISLFRIPGSWEEEAHQLMSAAGVTVLNRETSLDEAARLAVAGIDAQSG